MRTVFFQKRNNGKWEQLKHIIFHVHHLCMNIWFKELTYPWHKMKIFSQYTIYETKANFSTCTSTKWSSMHNISFGYVTTFKENALTLTLQLPWGDIKLLPPHLFPIWWEFNFEKFGSKENGTGRNMVRLKLQAKRCPQSAYHIPISRKANGEKPSIGNKKTKACNLPYSPYPSLTKFQATWAKAFWATLNFLIASTRGL